MAQVQTEKHKTTHIDIPEAVSVFDTRQDLAVKVMSGHSGCNAHVHPLSN